MESMAPSPGVRHCPGCGAVCPGRASICYKCKQPFPARSEPRALAPGEVEETVAQIRAEAPEASAAPDLASQPGRFGVLTKVLAVLVVGSAALGFIELAVGIFFGAFFGLLLLIAVVLDLRAPGARGRSTVEQAIRCYFHGVRRGRWKVAHACLSPQARKRHVRVPSIESLKTKPQDVVLATPADVKRYWLTIARPSGSLTRRIAAIKVTPVVDSGEVQRHRVTLTIQHYPSWIALTVLLGLLPALVLIAVYTTSKTHVFEVATYRFRSQWVLVSGEYESPVDKALPLPL